MFKKSLFIASLILLLTGCGQVSLPTPQPITTPTTQVTTSATPTPTSTVSMSTGTGSDQPLDVDALNTLTFLEQGGLYKNATLGFLMNFPAGWYVPRIETKTPDAYDCPTFYCEQALGVRDGAELMKKGVDELVSELTTAKRNPQRLAGFIVGADVIKSTMGDNDRWAYEYDVIFTKEQKAFIIYTNSEEVEAILLSFLLVK